MEYDAFVYYTRFDWPLGKKIVQMLEENGLACWDDKRDSHGFNNITEVLSSSRSFVIIGNNEGGSTYRYHLIREMMRIRNQQPIFLVCAKRTDLDLLIERNCISEESISIDVPVFSYEDPNYIFDEETGFTFSDYTSYKSHLEDICRQSAKLFDTSKFSFFIKDTILKELKNVVLYESPRVFISHSHLDNKRAEEVYEGLSDSGIKCWIDTKDIPAGASYPDAIVHGLEWCNCLVLIYSRNVIDSVDIPNELEVVHTDHKTIIPFLIDNAPISGGYRYYLPRKQWIDASKGAYMAMEKLKLELFRNAPEKVKDSNKIGNVNSDTTTLLDSVLAFLKKLCNK